MRFVLELELDNDAFQRSRGHAIVRGPLADVIARMPAHPMPGWAMKLRDENGNTVGEARIEE